MEKKKSFIFNVEWAEVLTDYPAEVRLEVYDAIIRYAASGTLSELKPLAKMAFSFAKREIDYNNERYTDIVQKRSEAGKTAMQRRWGKESDNTCNTCQQKVTNITSDNTCNTCQQKVTNITDNVYDNDINNKKASTNVDGKKGKKIPDWDLSFVDESFRPVFENWLAYKQERKESYKSAKSVKMAYERLFKLSDGNPAVAKEIIEQSIASNWAGLFEVKRKTGNESSIGVVLTDNDPGKYDTEIEQKLQARWNR